MFVCPSPTPAYPRTSPDTWSRRVNEVARHVTADGDTALHQRAERRGRRHGEGVGAGKTSARKWPPASVCALPVPQKLNALLPFPFALADTAAFGTGAPRRR